MCYKIILIALLFLNNVSPTLAQMAHGVLIKTNGDSIPATFAIPIFHDQIMNPLIFQDQPQLWIGGNKFDVDLSLYLEAQFEFADRPYTFRRVSSYRDGVCHLKFKHLIQDGDVQIYRNYFPNAFVSQAVNSEFFLLDSEKKSIPLRPLTFKKKLLKFFGNCPRFADLIRKRKFKYKQLDEIVAQYEDCCK